MCRVTSSRGDVLESLDDARFEFSNLVGFLHLNRLISANKSYCALKNVGQTLEDKTI
jgi:hypothetical protein